jgi:hypothetical protein
MVGIAVAIGDGDGDEGVGDDGASDGSGVPVGGGVMVGSDGEADVVADVGDVLATDVGEATPGEGDREGASVGGPLVCVLGMGLRVAAGLVAPLQPTATMDIRRSARKERPIASMPSLAGRRMPMALTPM